MLKKNIIKILFIFFLFFFSFNQSASAAGLVPCGLGVDDPCTLCHLFVLIDAILKFGMGILIAASLFGIAIGGIMYIVSSGRTTLIGQAKKIITNVLIGFALMLGAWLIVFVTLDYLMQADPTKIGKTNWFTFKCSTVSSSTVSAPGEIPSSSPPVDCGYLAKDANIANQCVRISPELQLVMNCMAEKLDKEKLKSSVSEYSDTNGNGAVCWDTISIQCTSHDQADCCHHKALSCHYGGTGSCHGFSHAMDIEPINLTLNEISAAAVSCGANAKIEGTHQHVSIVGACGCDGLHFAD